MIQMYGTAMEKTAKGPASKLPLTAARVAALAIGVPACLALIANTGYTLVSHIGRGTIPVSYAFPAGAGLVSVSLNGGNVALRQVGGDQASLAGTGSYSLIRPRITERHSGDTASLTYGCSVLFGNCSLNASVKVPAGTAVSVHTDGGDVSDEGTTGRVVLSTGGGNVTAARATGDLTLSTDGGDIMATGVASADVTADTGGGNIEIVFTRVPKDVRVSTDGGDITIVVPRGTIHYDVTASTAGGTVSDPTIPINTSSPHTITATSGGGDVTIRLAGS